MDQVPFGESRIVGIDERGIRVGEDHQRATLTDAEVELIRELRNPSDGAEPLSFGEIARKFEISKGTVFDIVNYRRRASTPMGYKRVRLSIVAPRTKLAIVRGL